MVGDVLELVTEEAGGVAGSRALVTVRRVAEYGSMEQSAECTWQRGETESMDVWARVNFSRSPIFVLQIFPLLIQILHAVNFFIHLHLPNFFQSAFFTHIFALDEADEHLPAFAEILPLQY